jgi:Na+-translocating ferredoxin:NAD+ oxidoreductase subunit C
MLHWVTRKRMRGGLVFGPPAWMPERVEETFEAPAPEAGAANGTVAAGNKMEAAGNPGALTELAERLGLGRTSGAIPGLRDQLRAAGTVKQLVLNLLPTQPESALGGALTRLALEELAAGLRVIERAVGPRRTRIVLDRHDVGCWRRWRRAARHWGTGEPAEAEAGVAGQAGVRRRVRRPRIDLLLNRYPQAEPTILVRTLFGKKLAVKALPTALGYLVVDPVTCWALGRYMRNGQRFTERPVQLFMPECGPRLVMGRLGEKLEEFCTRHEVVCKVESMQVIVNGMLAGREANPQTTRIEADTDSVALRAPMAAEPPAACLACGWCVDVCPTGLTPVHLMELARRLPEGSAARWRSAREARHCIGCGLCSYVCPTRLPLMEETLRLRERVAAAAPPAVQEVPHGS